MVGLPDDDYDDYADLEALHQASLKLGYEAGPVDILNEQPSFQRGHHSSSAFGDSWSRGVHKLVRDKGLLDPARHENLVMLPGAPRAVGPRRHAAGMIPGQQHGGATPSAGVFDTHQFVTHGTTSLNARDVPDGRGGIGSPAHTAARMQLVGGRKVRPRHRDSARLSSDDALPALEIGRVKKRRAFFKQRGRVAVPRGRGGGRGRSRCAAQTSGLLDPFELVLDDVNATGAQACLAEELLGF